MFEKKARKPPLAEPPVAAPVPEARPVASVAPDVVKQPLDCPLQECRKAVNHAGPHGLVRA